MIEPYSTIYGLLCLFTFAAAGILLIYWAVRGRSILLFILAMALVIWPIIGDVVNLLARIYAREALYAGDTTLIGVWEGSPAGFITKVAAIVNLIQAGLVLVASLYLIKWFRKVAPLTHHFTGRDKALRP